MIPSAWMVSRKGYLLIGLPLMLLAMVWVAKHAAQNTGHLGGTNRFSVLWIVVFGSLIWHLGLAWSEKIFVIKTAAEQVYLDSLSVTVAIPVHNEDPEALQRGLKALLQQTRLPQKIHVIENGQSDVSHDLGGVKAWFLDAIRGMSVVGIWTEIPEAGKRGGQLYALTRDQSDIFITMDSDTVADSKAIEEGLKPFVDQEITSVASVILAYNSTKPLVRLTDAWLLSFQLVVRAAMSRLGCVLVNSGNFALYRTSVIQKAIPSYAAEYFRGNKVEFSDDSLLTLFSHLVGKTVQQPSSFAFTVLPESISHHLRQQLRWMRGSTIRSVWRFRYLPTNGWGYWEHFFAWVNFVLVSVAFTYLVLLAPFTGTVQSLPLMGIFAVLVAYMTSLRYMTIRRSDQSVGSQLVSWFLAPVMLAWTAFVLRGLRIYAICTCWKTGWGTRQKVEVILKQEPVLETTA